MLINGKFLGCILTGSLTVSTVHVTDDADNDTPDTTSTTGAITRITTDTGWVMCTVLPGYPDSQHLPDADGALVVIKFSQNVELMSWQMQSPTSTAQMWKQMTPT